MNFRSDTCVFSSFFEEKGVEAMVQIRKEDIIALTRFPEAGLYADRLLTADVLRQEFESGVIRRKSLCDAFDIGESTLSTWLQAGRIPRVAAVAYVLWLSLRKLRDEIQQLDEMAAEPYVVHFRGGYAVVQPPNPTTPDAIGRVIASGIDTVELAREIAVARSPLFRRVLDQAVGALREYEEQFEDRGENNWVAQRADNLERARDFKVGPPSVDDL